MLTSATVNRRIATFLALALCLAGCAGEPVKLLTYSGSTGIHGTDVSVVSGLLLPDEQFGTVIRVEGEGRAVLGIMPDGLGYGDPEEYLLPVDDGRTLPVTWYPGYTGRLAGSEVEVLNAKGEVVARTGVRYVCAHHVDGSWGACEPAEAE